MSELKFNAAVLRSECIYTHTLSLSVLRSDGKVIISTLPSGPASGADLFRRLHPLERARIFSDPEALQGKRLLLPSASGGHLLYTGMCVSHGVIISAETEDIPACALLRGAQTCGFEPLKLRRAPKARCQNEDMTAAANFAASMIEIEQLFENASRIALTTEQAAEELICAFTRLSGVTARVCFDGICTPSLLQGVDGKTLGTAAIIASALAGDGKELSVIFRERSKRLWAEIGFCLPARGRTKAKLDELEGLCRGIEAFECKNFSISQDGTAVRLSYSPTVFDPTAEGLMQNNEIKRKD